MKRPRGNVVSGRGDTLNEHDILTGSRADGTAFAPQTDTTCKAWKSSGEGSAEAGHHDRTGPMPELGDVVELLAPVRRVQPRGLGAHRRVGAARLLRGRLRRPAWCAADA